MTQPTMTAVAVATPTRLELRRPEPRLPRGPAERLAILAPRPEQRPAVREMEVTAVVPGPVEVVSARVDFTKFPRFMRGVLAVRPTGDRRRLRWRATADGTEAEWLVELAENAPLRRLAWRQPRGSYRLGELLFDTVPEGTRVTLRVTSADAMADVEAIGPTWERLSADFDRLLELVWPGAEGPDLSSRGRG